MFYGGGGAAANAACLNAADYPDAWPDSRYTDNGDGTVSDTKTGLMWLTCSIGQALTDSACAGTASGHAWQAALNVPAGINIAGFAGHQDWRLPNIKELKSLVKYSCSDPAINAARFPNTANSYWSASPYAGSSGGAWQVFFFSGDAFASNRTFPSRVRLVRAGQ